LTVRDRFAGFLALFATLGLPASPAAAGEGLLRDATPGSGIAFLHSNGASGTKQYKEVMGSGVCLLDADGDGKLDVYLVNSVGANRLFRNLGDLHFEDVTDPAGVADADGYGMGAVAADVDNDGDDDLYVTNVGPNRLFLNHGDGTFTEGAARAGVADGRWSAGAAFLDADRDGVLDLYVVNYVQQAEPDSNVCRMTRGDLRLYCHPGMYPRETDVFYRGLGGGRFEDATAAAGLAGFEGRGLGVVASDIDSDGDTDLYVANDLDPNYLFLNRGDGTFEEAAAIAGCGYNEDGREESGMGVAIADTDGDGTLDILVTNFQNESNTFYRQEPGGFFFDESAASGLGAPSLPRLAWGVGFEDFDLDGRMDVYVANGHTESDIELVDQLATWKQPDQLFLGAEDGRFREVFPAALAVPRAGRGAAFGDLDGDGDVDVVLNNQREAATLLENTAADAGAGWVGFEVQHEGPNRAGLGWWITVRTGDGHRHVREFRAGGSYLSGDAPRAIVGLGGAPAPVRVELQRGPGDIVDLGEFAPNRYHVLDGNRPGEAP
jgi:hypothetical protein